MNVTLEGLNWWAIAGAAVSAQIIGMIWYSPGVFGKAWMKMVGLTMKDCQDKPMAGRMLAAFIATGVTAVVLKNMMGASTAQAGAEIAFWIWLGFIAPTTLGIVLWEQKPVKLYVLNNGYNLVSLLVIGAILGHFA